MSSSLTKPAAALTVFDQQPARAPAVAALRLLLSAALLLTSGVRAGQFTVPYRLFELDNGLRVVLSEDHSAPVVAVAVYYDVGSRNELKGRSGFAHLFEHMMFQGSRNVGKTEHFSYVESNGGELNGVTHSDHTYYYEYLPSNQLALALWLEADRMRSLAITRANLRTQREAVKEEKRLSIDNQAYWPALTKMDEMIFTNWANAHPVIGSMQDLDAATVSDVKKFFDTYYSPNNAVLAIAGDIDSIEAEQLVRKYFGAIPKREPPPQADVSEPFETARARAVFDDPLADVPAIALAWKIPGRRHRDLYPIELLKSLLADGDSARLYLKLVKQKAVSLDVEGFLDKRRGPSAVTILSIHKADVQPETVESLITQELDLIKAEGVAEAELAKVKAQFRLSRFTQGGDEGEHASLQTPLGRALALAEFTMFDRDPSLINTESDRYLEVTAEQVKQAARQYFGEANRSVLYIRPAKPK